MSESDTVFNERDRRCAAVQLILSTDPTYDNMTIAIAIAGLPQKTGTCPGRWKQFPATVMVFGVVSSEGHIMPPHIFDVGLKVNTKVYLDVLKSVVIPWCNKVAGGRLWVWQQDSAPVHTRPRLGFSRSAMTLYPSLTSPLLPRPGPAGLLRLVICREHHQHDLTQHQSQPDRRHPSSIRRASAGACGKGLHPVPDPYWGGDLGWRQLHWIDVSSAT